MILELSQTNVYLLCNKNKKLTTYFLFKGDYLLTVNRV